ncbi:MAG: aminotransferase class III-fold pyridoxal phosphate-dependent enzyme [Bacteroidales bacterium]|jgi:acetylornithine aminotransferase|nr:aminotransferase class III-fold pyridoxal phosphate-dependent enzyme [Bacteroidales bacterium]
MNLFDVYPLWDINLVKGEGCYVYDDKGQKYLDLYGGHAVISVGHSHPCYVKMFAEQLQCIGFYSNSVKNDLQEKLAEKLGQFSNYEDYALFLCNSGAEANENALKLASFHTGKKKILVFKKAFHGRTSGAVSATDNPAISAPFNETENIIFVPMNDINAVEHELKSGQYAAVIIEGIQGVAGIFMPSDDFMKQLRTLCTTYNAVLILDEIQSGYGRTGKFFAHQWAGIKADIITTAKGMGNGFPIGGVLIAPHIKPRHGMLGTTFGGNHLACAAALAVLEIMENERLCENAGTIGSYAINVLRELPNVEVRGRGLMIGIEMPYAMKELRDKLLFQHHIFTGNAGTNIIRLLPPLTISREEMDRFITTFKNYLSQ